MSNRIEQDDLVAAGFEVLDSHLIDQCPPRIRWGRKYQKMLTPQKLTYLERLASAMNHAAALIQVERDTLAKLCGKQERHIITLMDSAKQSDEVLQAEVTRMNADRQAHNREMARLREMVRDLGGEA